MKMSKILLGILSLTVAMVARGQAPSFLTNGLVAYYTFNGNSLDQSGNGNDLTNFGAMLCQDRFGHANQAYMFNGSAYLGSPVAPLTQIQNATISAWIQVGSLNQGPGFAVCLGENSAVNNGFGFGINAGNQLDAMYPGIVFAPDGYVFTNTSLWYQVVMTCNAGVATLYLNGIATPNSFSYNTPAPSAFSVGSGGAPFFGESLFFIGSIDDVRVYDLALTVEEVQQLYQYESTMDETPQALAVAEVTNGFMVGALVTYPGFGYTSTPTVTITGGGGSGALAQAVVINGMIAAIDILDAGSGYTNNPNIVIESPVDFHPFAATGTAKLDNGFVVGVDLTFGGFGYTNAPAVTFVGGGGSGARAVAVVSFGVVVAVNVMDAGYGYTSAPQVIIAPPYVPPPTLAIGASSLLTFSNLEVGTNYQFQTFMDTAWTNLGSSFTATNSIFTQYVSAAANPNLYRMATTPVPLQAYATPQVFNGFVIGATVTSGGTGYTASPAVTISGSSGSNAAAVASVDGNSVTGLTITDAGSDYTNASITIAPPPANALSPSVTPVWGLNMGNLSAFGYYQLQFSSNLSGGWTNLGSPTMSTTTTNVYYFSPTGPNGFFRLAYMP